MNNVLWCVAIFVFTDISSAELQWSKAAGPRGALRIPSEFNIPKIGSDFDYLMLTRIYPTAVCRADDDTVPESCEIPPETPKWTIHGLWPNYKNGSYPQFCDGIPKKFDVKLIESIRSRLHVLWPNLYPTKTVESFWKHEWEKHGTCGESDQRLKSEILYFQSTIDLNSLHDVNTALKSGGIVPRLEPYHKEDIQKALNDQLGKGHHVQFNCLKDRKTHQSLLGDVRMCVNRDFEIVDCDKEKSKQPVTEILGQEAHLPSFRPCPAQITYLPDIMIADEDRVKWGDSSVYMETAFNLRPLFKYSSDNFFRFMMLAPLLIFVLILIDSRRNNAKVVRQQYY